MTRPTQEWLVWQCNEDRTCSAKCPAFVDDPYTTYCGLFARQTVGEGHECYIAALADALGTPLLHTYATADEEAFADLTDTQAKQQRELGALKQEVAALRQQIMGGRNGTAPRRSRRVR